MVSPPPDEELFADLLRGNAGSAEALQILGIVDDLKLENEDRQRRGKSRILATDKSRVAKVKNLYEYVRAKLRDLNKSHLLPDMFHFEHLLCKVKRVMTKGPTRYKTFDAFLPLLEKLKKLKADRRPPRKGKTKKKVSARSRR